MPLFNIVLKFPFQSFSNSICFVNPINAWHASATNENIYITIIIKIIGAMLNITIGGYVTFAFVKFLFRHSNTSGFIISLIRLFITTRATNKSMSSLSASKKTAAVSSKLASAFKSD
jgi:ABC-type glycerol-3-phosphate transport system permease component